MIGEQGLSLSPVPTDSPWYFAAPIGCYMLQKMLPMMCKEAGIPIRTNHSLRATSATDMFHAGIPEKVIQSHTGHRSLRALRMYENPTDEQHTAACNVLIQKGHVSPPEVIEPDPESCTPKQGNTIPGAGAGPLSMFASVQNCTINMHVYNQATIGKVLTQGAVEFASPDDMFIDSLLSSSDFNL